MDEFICESELNEDEILAAESAGELLPWRHDCEGRLWYRRIHGVPPESWIDTLAFDRELVDVEVDDWDEDE